MELRNLTADGLIATGSKVLVRSDAVSDFPYWDIVRGVFTQTILLEPHSPNEDVEALVLTTRSWCRVSDVICVQKGGTQ
jgi:hypothetical protein